MLNQKAKYIHVCVGHPVFGNNMASPFHTLFQRMHALDTKMHALDINACIRHLDVKYSGTSDKGPSEIGTTSLQRTLVAVPC